MKELLTLVTTVPAAGTAVQQTMTHPQTGQAMRQGSCLMDMLMTVQALQYPLLDLLLDVMLMCCQHLIMLEGQSWDLNDTEEEDQLDEDSVSAEEEQAEAGLATSSQEQQKKPKGDVWPMIVRCMHTSIALASPST